MKIKKFFEAEKKLIGLNLINRYGCPSCNCLSNECEYSTKFGMCYNEPYKRYEYYLKCENCGQTTPAFSDPIKALDSWEYLEILIEDKVCDF